jgi:plasmid stabilization system protein ParE
VRVALSGQAATQAQEIDGWWRDNRLAAPDLFTRELEEALQALEQMPSLGTRYEPKPDVRRLLLRRTQYHLYFVEEGDTLYVVSVWSALRGHGPRL